MTFRIAPFLPLSQLAMHETEWRCAPDLPATGLPDVYALLGWQI